MRILITGAGGFLGQFLARELLKDPSHSLVLTDVVDIPLPSGAPHEKVKTIKADLCESPSAVVDASLDAAYVFHGIMSAGAEANFDLGMRVNVDATRSLLDTIRKVKPGLRVIYASSQAVYGQPLPKGKVTEDVVPTPQGSYGAEKLICETLVNDYTRRGFIDGFSLRFPTISVRPGKPTAAASSFISGIIREPLANQECVVPIQDRSFPSWVCSPKTLISNLLHALTLPSDALPSHKRTVNAPGLLVTIQDMMDALEKVGGKDKLRYIREEHDDALAAILRSWAFDFDNKLARDLGYKPDSSFEEAVREYVEYMKAEGKS